MKDSTQRPAESVSASAQPAATTASAGELETPPTSLPQGTSDMKWERVPNRKKPAPVVMYFTFDNLPAASEFEAQLYRFGIEVNIFFKRGRWQVKTNSDCLAYATELKRFLGGLR